MKNQLLSYQSLSNDLAALFLRLIFGGLFTYYGFQKLVAYSEYAPHFPDLIGIGGKTSFILVIFAEFACGLLIVFGFLTRLAVIPIFIAMLVAFFIAHAKDPFAVKQIAFAYMLLPLVIFVMGSGRFSLDKVLLKK